MELPDNLLEDLSDFLQKRLMEALPALTAHLKMVPESRRGEFVQQDKGKSSAVLLLLFPDGDEIKTIFIQRPVYPGYHSGQISLPGGKASDEDHCLEDTALREAREEVNIIPDEIRVLGKLSSLYIPPSGFLLTPFVASCNHRPHFIAQVEEVETMIEVGIRYFSDNFIRTKDIALHDGRIATMPYYDAAGYTIWGATAMVMSEFSALLYEFFEKQRS